MNFEKEKKEKKLLKPNSNCSELKRRLKAEQKAREKAEKEDIKAAAQAQAKPSKKKNVEEEEINSNVKINKTLYVIKLI